MTIKNLSEELSGCAYPGRGIVAGMSEDGKKAVSAYFIMGRSESSRNRVFVQDGEGIRTEAFDPSTLLVAPELIIYAPVRVLGNNTIVTNGDQTDTVYDGLSEGKTFEESLLKLEVIIRELESGEVPLDDMVKKGELTVEQGKVLNEELKHNLKQTVKNNVNVKVKVTTPEELSELLDKMTPEQLEALKAQIKAKESTVDSEAEEVDAEDTAEDVENVDDAEVVEEETKEE